MNSRERVFIALERKIPDAIPTFEWEISNSVIQQLFPDYDLFDFVDDMDLDAVVATPDYEIKKIDENTFEDEWGVIRKKGIEEYLVPIDDHSPLKEIKDFHNYSLPDPKNDKRFGSLEKAVKRFKGKKAIVFKLRDAFSTPRDLRGFTRFLMDIELNPDFVKDLVDMSVNYNIMMGREAIKKGAEIVFTGDDYASNEGMLMSPKSFREIFLPGIKKIVHEMKSEGAYFIKHTDGYIMEVLEDLIEADIDCIDPIDPRAGMDIEKVKKLYGNRVAIKGNVDCVETLTQKTENEVTREVLECISKAAFNGGYIISSSNTIHAGVNPANYKKMLEIVREYGTYPVNREKIEQVLDTIRE